LAQTHKVEKTEAVVRAVVVYEWTGEAGKATANRVVPVSLFIDGKFQDAGIYMARPVPLALDTDTVYSVRKAGVETGTLDLKYQRRLIFGETEEIDDGWLGFGAMKMKPKEVLRPAKPGAKVAVLVVNGKTGSKPDQPKFAGKAPESTADTEDPDRPSFHRRETPDTSTGSSSGTAPADSGSGASSGPNSDPADRPTLKRRSAEERKADQKRNKDTARVMGGSDLNDDPDRPTLKRGTVAENLQEENPPLRGLPRDMQQMVAISDAKDRPEHDFARMWLDSDEKAEVMGKMQEFARAQLAGYQGVGPAVAAPAQASSAGPANKSKLRKRMPIAPPPPPLALNDEMLKGFTLSYGGAATFVYMATSPGANGATRYVTVVAQDEPTVGLKLALASVTDSTHLDRTPWMRLVDVVDADASNRASLVMELRAAHTRQFALYRVIGARAEQIFLTGSTE
jgi:hypothetical protein